MAIGWLAGLSTSPVISHVISACLAVVISVAGIACGINEIKGKRLIFNPAPCFFLVCGVALAGPIGIAVRTHSWFGNYAQSSPQDTAKKENPPWANPGFNVGSYPEWENMTNSSGKLLRERLQRFDKGVFFSLVTNLNDADVENLKIGLINLSSDRKDK